MADKEYFKKIPPVYQLLNLLAEKDDLKDLSREFLKKRVCELLAEIRNGKQSLADNNELARRVARDAHDFLNIHGYRKVINATGIVVHTNLGRAVLPGNFFTSLVDNLSGYGTLEYDLSKGERGRRGNLLFNLISSTLNCEDALVVNNNAAAVLLVLNTFARGKKALISRGELIEIGGSFRIPDIMEAAGASLFEVGTTNRTHYRDYENALKNDTSRVGLILKVHCSNFRIEGFCKSLSAEELLPLSKKYGTLLFEDLGSGLIQKMKSEPDVIQKLSGGLELLSFSGDKLLGGSQAGILAGKSQLIQKLKNNPLYRCLRPGKIDLHLMEELFKIYLCYAKPEEHIPTLAMLNLTRKTVKKRVLAFIQAKKTHKKLKVEPLKLESQAGGGALPGENLPSFGLSLSHCELSARELAVAFRDWKLPIIGYSKDEKFILDFRTILASQEKELLKAINSFQ
ncbi:L-seryl-tRNA(Sec) selenium transferase [Candidatus Riflebacteria bacterium]